MKYILFTLLALTTIIFSNSCSKEKQLLKNLEGEWSVVSADTSTTLEYTFEDCNSGNNCDGSYYYETHNIYLDTAFTANFTWELNGEQLTTIYDDNNHILFDVVEWEDNYMKWDDITDGVTLELNRLK